MKKKEPTLAQLLSLAVAARRIETGRTVDELAGGRSPWTDARLIQNAESGDDAKVAGVLRHGLLDDVARMLGCRWVVGLEPLDDRNREQLRGRTVEPDPRFPLPYRDHVFPPILEDDELEF